MFTTNLDLDATIRAKIEALRPQLESGALLKGTFWQYYQQSEQLLITLMTPPYTAPPYTANGSLEYSWVLYFLNEYANWIPSLPPSKITQQDWTNWGKIWDGNGVCYGDGSLVNTSQYGIMDLRWAIAYLGYFENKNNKHPFNYSYNTTTVTTTSHPQQLSLGLFGDWGTVPIQEGTSNPSPSADVMAQLANLNPDILVHLGDVYYKGAANEEQANLLNQWKPAPVANFTLNSNHEMYSGANGLFDPTLKNSIFAAQAQSTFFQINYGDWIIVGLDSAYNSTDIYMDGAITDTAQLDLLKSLQGYAATGKKLLVLTHHNPLIEPGGQTNSLWTDVTNALGCSPDVWYWGHVHNGIVYANNSGLTGNTACRCLGHAAIPYGNASWFENNSNITYYTNKTPNPSTGNPVQAMNGFAVLSLTPNGGITETWYYQDGSIAWTN